MVELDLGGVMSAYQSNRVLDFPLLIGVDQTDVHRRWEGDRIRVFDSAAGVLRCVRRHLNCDLDLSGADRDNVPVLEERQLDPGVVA